MRDKCVLGVVLCPMRSMLIGVYGNELVSHTGTSLLLEAGLIVEAEGDAIPKGSAESEARGVDTH